VAKGSELRFFVTVRNQTGAPIYNVELKGPTAEGLDVAQRCWCGGTTGVCGELAARAAAPGTASDASKSSAAPCGPLAAQLAPGQSVAVWGDLHAAKATDKEAVIGEVDWTNGAGAEARRSNDAFSLGETVIQGWFEQFRSSSFYDFLKDISLPLVLALLAAALAWYDKSRERKRSAAAEERAHTLQTWGRMLPISHKLATKYYMPIEGATRAAIDALDQRQKALDAAGDPKASATVIADKTQEAEDKEEEVFFYSLLMRRRLRILFDEKGGWYFKDRIGEELSNQCLNEHYELCLDKPVAASTALSVATGMVEANEKLGAFRNILHGTNAEAIQFQDLLKYFRVWLKSPECKPAFDNLRAWRELLSYEMNRPYEYWYGSQEKLSLDKAMRDTILAAAQKIQATPPGSPDFEGAAKRYLDSAAQTATLQAVPFFTRLRSVLRMP
jgi:hypothetical protein